MEENAMDKRLRRLAEQLAPKVSREMLSEAPVVDDYVDSYGRITRTIEDDDGVVTPENPSVQTEPKANIFDPDIRSGTISRRYVTPEKAREMLAKNQNIRDVRKFSPKEGAFRSGRVGPDEDDVREVVGKFPEDPENEPHDPSKVVLYKNKVPLVKSRHGYSPVWYFRDEILGGNASSMTPAQREFAMKNLLGYGSDTSKWPEEELRKIAAKQVVKQDDGQVGDRYYRPEDRGAKSPFTQEEIDAIIASIQGNKISESYTTAQLNEAFKAAGLDTKKFTTEYLAERLGFKRLK
jgi:hypothetical protein